MLKWLFLLYALVSAAVIIVRYPRAPKEWLARGSIVLALPGIGWLMPLFWPSRWYETRNMNKTDRDIFADDEFHVQFSDINAGIDMEKELNVIAVEDALVINEHADRRKVMIDLLKTDAMQHLDVLQKAVSNEDTETSHYAVSAIVEVKRSLTLALQQLAVQHEADKDDLAVLRAYSEVIDGYARSGFLDGQTLRNYKMTYRSLLEREIRLDPASEAAYIRKTKTENELGLYRDAEETAGLYRARYPDKEEPYLLLIETYYLMRSHDRLQETLMALKQSSVRLSSEGLQQVRFWSEGA